MTPYSAAHDDVDDDGRRPMGEASGWAGSGGACVDVDACCCWCDGGWRGGGRRENAPPASGAAPGAAVAACVTIPAIVIDLDEGISIQMPSGDTQDDALEYGGRVISEGVGVGGATERGRHGEDDADGSPCCVATTVEAWGGAIQRSCWSVVADADADGNNSPSPIASCCCGCESPLLLPLLSLVVFKSSSGAQLTLRVRTTPCTASLPMLFFL